MIILVLPIFQLKLVMIFYKIYIPKNGLNMLRMKNILILMIT